MSAFIFTTGAIIATIVGGGLAIGVVWWEFRKYPWVALVAGLPLAVVANRLIKKPLLEYLVLTVGGFEAVSLRILPVDWSLLVYFTTPVVEELVKVLPALFMAKMLIDFKNRCCVGFALGTGYGLGEAWWLAYAFAGAWSDPPTIAIIGFSAERAMVIVGHGITTMLAVQGIGLGIGRFLSWYLLAVALHATFNIGAGMFQAGLLSLEGSSLVTVAGMTVVILIAGAIVSHVGLFERSAKSEQVLVRRREDS